MTVRSTFFERKDTLKGTRAERALWERNETLKSGGFIRDHWPHGIKLRLSWNGDRDSWWEPDDVVLHNDGTVELQDAKVRIKARTPAASMQSHQRTKAKVAASMHPFKVTVMWYMKGQFEEERIQ